MRTVGQTAGGFSSAIPFNAFSRAERRSNATTLPFRVFAPPSSSAWRAFVRRSSKSRIRPVPDRARKRRAIDQTTSATEHVRCERHRNRKNRSYRISRKIAHRRSDLDPMPSRLMLADPPILRFAWCRRQVDTIKRKTAPMLAVFRLSRAARYRLPLQRVAENRRWCRKRMACRSIIMMARAS